MFKKLITLALFIFTLNIVLAQNWFQNVAYLATSSRPNVVVVPPIIDTNAPDLLWYQYTNNLNGTTLGPAPIGPNIVVFNDDSQTGGSTGYFRNNVGDTYGWVNDPYGTTNGTHRGLLVCSNSTRINWTTQDRTIEFAYRPSTFATAMILGNIDNNTNGFRIMGTSGTGTLGFETYSNGVFSGGSSVGTVISSGQWSWFAFVIKGGTNVIVYRNGVPDANWPAFTITRMPLSVSNLVSGITDVNNNFDGDFYSLAVFSNIRSVGQIASDYTKDATVQRALYARYATVFTAGTANDASGNSRNGTWTGTPTYDTNGLGQANSAFKMNGTQYIDTGIIASTSIFTLGFTINLWVNETAGGSMAILSDDTIADNSGMIDIWTPLSGTDLYANSYIPTKQIVQKTVAFGNKWTMITVSYANTGGASAYFVYTNSVPFNSPPAGSGNILPSLQSIIIGRRGSYNSAGNFFNYSGLVSDISIYTNALDAGRIVALYYKGTNGAAQ